MPDYTGPRATDRVIRDPIHDYVDMPLELNGVIDRPEVQRLRRVSQTSMCSAVYPSMSGTRFEHALGAMHLAGAAWRSACANSQSVMPELVAAAYDSIRSNPADQLDPYTRNWVRNEDVFASEFEANVDLAVQTAALLHDVGHPPFSHALEGFYSRHLDEIRGRTVNDDLRAFRHPQRTPSFHERAGKIILATIGESDAVANLPWYLAVSILHSWKNTWVACLHDIVSGEVDVDRIDYLMRDSTKSGTEFGALDVQRLLDSLEIHPAKEENSQTPWKTGFGLRALSAIEGFLDLRLQYYRWVIFHPHAVAANHILVQALEDAATRSLYPNEAGGAWLERLNYFDSRTGGYRAAPPHYVDDGTIIEVLKAMRTGVWRPRSRADRTFCCLVDATLDRRANWAPIWKTEHDYDEVARMLLPTLIAEFRALESQLAAGFQRALADRRLTEEVERQQQAHTLVSEFVSSVAAAAYPGAGASGAVNLIAKRLFGENRPNDRHNKQILLSRYLDNATSRLRQSRELGIPEGTWVVAYEPFDAVRSDHTATEVYDADEPIQVLQASALVFGLQFVEQRRVSFFVYYLAISGELMREGRDSLFKRELQDVFMEIFPRVIANLLPSLLTMESGDSDA